MNHLTQMSQKSTSFPSFYILWDYYINPQIWVKLKLGKQLFYLQIIFWESNVQKLQM